MSTNGLISFGRSVSSSNPVLFPSTTAIIARSYIVAPFWADFDTTIGGSVSWWTETSDSISVGAVSNFITQQQQYGDFSGTWMLVASWEDMQPSVAVSLVHTLCFRIRIHCLLLGYYLPSYPYNRWIKVLCSVHIQVWRADVV